MGQHDEPVLWRMPSARFVIAARFVAGGDDFPGSRCGLRFLAPGPVRIALRNRRCGEAEPAPVSS